MNKPIMDLPHSIPWCRLIKTVGSEQESWASKAERMWSRRVLFLNFPYLNLLKVWVWQTALQNVPLSFGKSPRGSVDCQHPGKRTGTMVLRGQRGRAGAMWALMMHCHEKDLVSRGGDEVPVVVILMTICSFAWFLSLCTGNIWLKGQVNMHC